MIGKELLEKYNKLKSNPGSEAFKIRSVRDLLIMELTEEFWMIVASDSDGGIGPKIKDTVHCAGYDLGRFAARVPLMEMIACGAVPVIIVDVLAVEMDPTGKDIIEGIRDEAEQAGMNKNLVVTGSTEDNVETVQTGLGVVVIGIIKKEDFRPGKSEANDAVICVGYPKSAPADIISFNDNVIANLDVMRRVSKLDFVHDILPVGSKGIKYELHQLAGSADLKPSIVQNVEINTHKSGGPTTCFLVSLPENFVDRFIMEIKNPVTKIGRLIKHD